MRLENNVSSEGQRVVISPRVAWLLGAAGVGFVLGLLLAYLPLTGEGLLGILLPLFVTASIWLAHELVSLRSELLERMTVDREHLDERLTEDRQHIDRKMTQVSEAARIYEAIARSAVNSDAAMGLVTEIAKVSEERTILCPLYDGLVHDLTGLAANLNSAQADHIIDGEDEQLLLGLTNAASRSILTVSDSLIDGEGDLAFWASDLGRRYLHAQEVAVKQRGVVIKRLFVVDNDPAESDDSGADAGGLLAQVMDQQRAIGIECQWISRKDKLPPALVDSIVFDDEVLYQSLLGNPEGFSLDGGHIQQTQVTRNRDKVEKFRKAFEEAWEEAKARPATLAAPM